MGLLKQSTERAPSLYRTHKCWLIRSNGGAIPRPASSPSSRTARKDEQGSLTCAKRAASPPGSISSGWVPGAACNRGPLNRDFWVFESIERVVTRSILGKMEFIRPILRERSAMGQAAISTVTVYWSVQ
jgi:hypothetical protein